MVQVMIRSWKSWSGPKSLLSMSKLTSEPESTGFLKRMTDGFHTVPSRASMVIVQWGPVTVTAGVDADTTWVPFPEVAPAMVKRCGAAALFDLTDTVQVPCIASDMVFSPQWITAGPGVKGGGQPPPIHISGMPDPLGTILRFTEGLRPRKSFATITTHPLVGQKTGR